MNGRISGLLRVVTISWMCGAVLSGDSSRFTDRRLLDALLDGYKPFNPRNVRPSPLDVPVIVRVYPSIIRINDIDERSGILKSRISVSMSWTDDLLTWDPSMYNNITRIHVPPGYHWLPDIDVHNSVTESSHPRTDRWTLLTYTGIITAVVFLDVQTNCPLDFHNYPRDTQTCTVTLVSWMYSSRHLEMIFWNEDKYSMEVQMWEDPVGDAKTHNNRESTSGTNPRWELVDKTGTGSIRKVTFSCCPDEPFDQLTMALTLKRRHMSITCLFKWHILVFLLLVPSQFVLPYTAGIRTIYGLFIVIGLIHGLPSLYTFLPHGMASLPTIGQVYIAGILSSAIAVILSVLIISIATRKSRRSNPPKWAMRVSGVLQHVFCMTLVRRKEPSVQTVEPMVGNNNGNITQNVQNPNEIGLHKLPDGNTEEMAPCLQQADEKIGEEWRTLTSVLDRLCLFMFVIVFIIHAAVIVTL